MYANLTDKEKVIAEYWADGPASELPPGHWCLFGQWISNRDNYNLDQDVQMFFLIGNAVMDSGIASWEAKQFYDTSRPITAFRYYLKDQQVRSWVGGTTLAFQTTTGQNWLPYQPDTFITPPFPEYVSGHSTFSSASAEVLKRFTGSDAFGWYASFGTGYSKIEVASPKSVVTLGWASFTEAANEAGLSRIYGGIHFESGNLEGQKLGRKIGESVWNKAQTFFNGTAT